MKGFCIVATACFISTRLTAQPVIIVQPTNQVVLANNTNLVFSVQASGNGPLTYQWFFNGTNVPNDVITTLAGKGPPPGFSGDRGAATNAHLNNPYGVAGDSLGNVFIADTRNNRIRKVDTNGIITTIAGTNAANLAPGGYSGDGGAATNARLNYPSGVAVDHFGNVYIADFNNARIRKVNTNGMITTIAGNGTNGYYGDSGPATNAEIKIALPCGLCLDAMGNLYLADAGNNCIRKIDTNGIISTVTTGGSSGGVAVDTFGNIYFSDGSRVSKLDTNNLITIVAGGGSSLVEGISATNAQINPWGLLVDTNGNLFFGDQLNNNRRAVRKVDSNGILTTVAGKGPLGNSGDGGLAIYAEIGCPYGIAGDSSGNLLIADEASSSIRKVWFHALPTVTVSNLFPTSTGNYQVVVTDSSGSVTSNIASLSIVYPSISGKVATNNGSRFVITWPVFQPSVFQVQWTTNLTGSNWSNLGSTITWNNVGIIGQLDYSWTNYIQGFYRLIWLQ